VGANKWFAGVQCWPPETVEIFDLGDPAAPVLEASLPFADAASLFGRLSGGSLILPTTSGFSVHGLPVQP